MTPSLLDPGRLAALAQVLFVDVALAGDNAVVVGMAVAGLPAPQRRAAVALGLGGAALLRIAFALVALRLLAVIGLTLAGGLLLLWVCYKMWREIGRGHAPGAPPTKTLRAAVTQILVADLSMSLDNVLAVAGAAGRDGTVLVLGLAGSVLLMGLAANLVARLLERFRWIAWVGLAVVLGVALRMIWHGTHEVARALA